MSRSPSRDPRGNVGAGMCAWEAAKGGGRGRGGSDNHDDHDDHFVYIVPRTGVADTCQTHYGQTGRSKTYHETRKYDPDQLVRVNTLGARKARRHSKKPAGVRTHAQRPSAARARTATPRCHPDGARPPHGPDPPGTSRGCERRIARAALGSALRCTRTQTRAT